MILKENRWMKHLLSWTPWVAKYWNDPGDVNSRTDWIIKLLMGPTDRRTATKWHSPLQTQNNCILVLKEGSCNLGEYKTKYIKNFSVRVFELNPAIYTESNLHRFILHDLQEEIVLAYMNLFNLNSTLVFRFNPGVLSQFNAFLLILTNVLITVNYYLPIKQSPEL